MPVTVPSSPSSGDTPAIVPSVLMKRSSSWHHVPPGVLEALHEHLARAVAIGETGGEQPPERGILLERRDDLVVHLIGLDQLPHALRQLLRQHRLSCSVHSRSRMIAAAVIEHRMIGHISGPPARTISHIRSDPNGR